MAHSAAHACTDVHASHGAKLCARNGAGRDRIDRYAYLPFGAGPRICIGSAFSLQEATLVLAKIMHQFELTLVPDHAVWPLQRVTLRPRGGLPVIVRRRVA
jgi:cytochrome P450